MLAILAAACLGSDGPGSGTGSLETCPVDVRLVATLGNLEDPEGIRGERDLYVLPLGGDGGWAVLEPLATRVLRYDPDGAFLGHLGERGSGPGELSRPWGLALAPDGDLWISDTQGRWVVFGADGEALQTVPTRGFVPFHGITNRGEFYTLHLAALMSPAEEFQSSAFFARRWDAEARELDPVGPGVKILGDNPRVAQVQSPHRLLHQREGRFLLTANFEDWGPTAAFPGSPAIHAWEGDEARVLVAFDDLVAAPGFPRSRGRAEFLMRAIGPSHQDDQVWAFGHLKREGQPPGIDPPPGAEGTIRNSPALRNGMFEGVAWLVHLDGSVTCALLLPMLPDGVVAANTYFSLTEDESTGHREVAIWAVNPLGSSNPP